MNRKVLILSTIAMVPLFLMFVSSAVLNIQDVEASGTNIPYQYGIRTQITACGHHLCNAEKTVTAVDGGNVVRNSPTPDHMPEIQIVETNNFEGTNPNAYVVTLKVTSGNKNLEHILIYTTSDITTIDSKVPSLLADSDATIVVKIKAMDVTSIHAGIQTYNIRAN